MLGVWPKHAASREADRRVGEHGDGLRRCSSRPLRRRCRRSRRRRFRRERERRPQRRRPIRVAVDSAAGRAQRRGLAPRARRGGHRRPPGVRSRSFVFLPENVAQLRESASDVCSRRLARAAQDRADLLCGESFHRGQNDRSGLAARKSSHCPPELLVFPENRGSTVCGARTLVSAAASLTSLRCTETARLIATRLTHRSERSSTDTVAQLRYAATNASCAISSATAQLPVSDHSNRTSGAYLSAYSASNERATATRGSASSSSALTPRRSTSHYTHGRAQTGTASSSVVQLPEPTCRAGTEA